MTKPLTITIDIDELIDAIVERLDAVHSMLADRAPDRRQKAWIARAAKERAKRRAQRRGQTAPNAWAPRTGGMPGAQGPGTSALRHRHMHLK